MKTSTVLSGLCILALFVASCRDKIDVPTDPGTTVGSDSTEAIVFTQIVTSLSGKPEKVATSNFELFPAPSLSRVLQQNAYLADVHGKLMLYSLNDSLGVRLLVGTLAYYGAPPMSIPNLSQPGPVIAPNEKRIAYSVETGQFPSVTRHIHLMDINGYNDIEIYAGAQYNSEMRFSPDGTKLAFFALPSIGAYDSVMVYDIARRSLTTIGVAMEAYGSLTMAWSSTNLIAYRDGNSTAIVKPDGSTMGHVETGIPLSWSPDGKTLAYGTIGQQSDIYLTTQDGGIGTQLTNTSTQSEVAAHWSGDGKRLLATTFPVGSNSMDWGLEEIDVATKSFKTLGSNGLGYGYFVQK